jgi:peptidoglycan hydrolase FlgJ
MTQIANIGPGSSIAVARTAPVADPAKAEQRAALEKAAKGFEAVFMRQLLGSMRNASLGESIDGSSAVEQFREMSDANMADSLASKNSLGIAQLLLKSLDK